MFKLVVSILEMITPGLLMLNNHGDYIISNGDVRRNVVVNNDNDERSLGG